MSPARLLPLLALLLPAPATALEVAARLGVSAPAGDSVGLGPTAGMSLGVPLKWRFSLVAAGDLSTHGVAAHPGRRVEAVTATVGLEAALDFLPIVPALSLGPSYQHAWRRDSGASSDAWGGYLALGLKATVLSHLRLGLQARYLSSALTARSFPAFATYSFEVGWTL